MSRLETGDLLSFPAIADSVAWPASTGTLSVLPLQSRIFGAGPSTVCFGTGQVYFKGWSNDETAIFQRTIRSGSADVPYDLGLKTPVVSDPSYSGPILLTGLEPSQ